MVRRAKIYYLSLMHATLTSFEAENINIPNSVRYKHALEEDDVGPPCGPHTGRGVDSSEGDIFLSPCIHVHAVGCSHYPIWMSNFNASKCKVMHVGHKLNTKYYMNEQDGIIWN